MPRIACDIVAWIADEPQPGLVRARVVDATGAARYFVDKSAVFTEETVDAATAYPRPGFIRCVVERTTDGDTVRVDTSEPDGVESEDGQSVFEVPRALVE